MSRSPRLLPLAAFALALPAGAAEPGGFDLSGIGREAMPEEIAGWAIDILPDGTGAPEGRGNVAEGEDLFVMYCAVCHGDFGEGAGRWPQLAGGAGSLDSHDPIKTVGSYWPHASTLVDYIYRAMPFGYAQSLTPDEFYAISAYVLWLGDVVLDDDFELSHENLGQIEMPNAGGFFPDDRETAEAHFWDEPCMTDCGAGEAVITMRAAVLDVTPDDDGAGMRID
jgi:mono/diheme cytochrome c family protein